MKLGWKGPTTVKTPAQCCQLPELIPQSVFQKCEAANPKPPPKTGPMMPKGKLRENICSPLLKLSILGCCISECVMNETKIMANGNLDKAAAVKYLTEKLSGDAEAIKVNSIKVL